MKAYLCAYDDVGVALWWHVTITDTDDYHAPANSGFKGMMAVGRRVGCTVNAKQAATE